MKTVTTPGNPAYYWWRCIRCGQLEPSLSAHVCVNTSSGSGEPT